MSKFKVCFILLVVTLFPSLGMWAQTPSFSDDQYQKALWMTTRFYGAQRSGHGPNWLIADYEPTDVANDCKGNLSAFVKGKSYIKDADGDYDLTGGWYDCGDFATFGQTFFYSAYMLVLAYLEFPAGFDDFYSTDYHGYVESGDYTWEGKKGVPDGIPDILNEAKYAVDFIIKAVRNENTFYYQKGDGDADHKVWCTSPTKSTLKVGDGGEADGVRYMGKATGNVTSMASLAGAALAGMAQAYMKFDPEYANLCLEKAKVCYKFVTSTTKGNSGACAFYGNKPKYVTDETIFYAEMYRATLDEQYLKAAEASATWMKTEANFNHNFSLCYNNTEDLGCYLMASLGDKTEYSKYGKEALEFFVKLYKPSSGYFLNVKNDGWGVLRFPANQAFVYGLYAKLNGSKSIDPYALTSIEYIMGKNGANFSYIVGFGDKHPFYPHHRNFYRTDNNNEGNLPTITKDYKYVQLGYMVGGSLDNGSYKDIEKEYTYSEGGIDYNAGLVGALGYINSILSPVDVNKFGHPSPKLGEDKTLCGVGTVTINAVVDLSNLGEGEKVTYKWYKNDSPLSSFDGKESISVSEAGTYKCEVVETSGAWSTSDEVVVSDVLPDFTIGEDIQLCKETSATFKASLQGQGLTYSWSKDGKQIADAIDSIYTVYTAGTYGLTIAATGCESKTVEVNVTSLLPEVEGAVICNPGIVSLAVLSDGDYEWYADAEGGSPLATGSVYSTSISESTTFYVQDAGSISATAGPSEKQLSNDRTYGDKKVHFTTSGEVQITQISVSYSSVYHKSEQTLTATLSGDAEGVFVSAAENVQNAGSYTFSFEQNPINITKAGTYVIEFKPGNAEFNYSTNCNYDEFAYSDIIKFNSGSTNDYAFPVIFDWKISAGSSCSRTPVLAIVDESDNCVGGYVDLNVVESSDLAIFPNPVENQLFVNLDEMDVLLQSNIYSSTGAAWEVEPMGNRGLISFDVANLNPGIYVLELVTESGVKRSQFIKR